MRRHFDSMDSSIAYYDQNAKAFLEGTANLDMQALYGPFLSHVPRGGHILDAGCGSGRDARAFLDQGYKVTAFDASKDMVTAATTRTRQPVLQLRFAEMAFNEEFDGIWACASLLHVPRSEIASVFERFAVALKPRGVWYMSFRLGEGEEIRSGRLFNCYTEVSLAKQLSQIVLLTITRFWNTNDVRADGRDDLWINAIVQRKAS